MDQYDKWLRWAGELQSIAQAGLYYEQNIYDRERYERIRDISAEIMSFKSGLPQGTVEGLFCNDSGYITPKLDTRAAVFREDGILLVKEATGKWALPGGWVEADLSLWENTVKEVREEAGLDVVPRRLIAALDRDRHNFPLHARKIIICFVLCENLGTGGFRENSETVEARYFPLDDLPSPLAVEKTTEEEIRLCFNAYRDEHWQTVFD